MILTRSFSKYKASVGTYFTNEKSNNLDFVTYKKTSTVNIRRFILKNSAIARYIYFNLEPSTNIIHKYPICKLFGVICNKDIHYLRNNKNEPTEYKNRRLKDGKFATDLFLKELSLIIPNKLERKRYHIYY